MTHATVHEVLSGAARWCVLEGEALVVMHEMPAASVDAIITDPPYSSGGAFRSDRMGSTKAKYVQTGQERQFPEFAGDSRDQHAYAYWVALWLAECTRVAKPGAPICLFSDWRQLPTTIDSMQAGGWVYRGIVPWDKGGGVRPTLGRFSSQCEYVVWGSNGPMPLEREVGGESRVLPGIIRCAVDVNDKHHMTGKPTEAMRALVRIVEPGGVIFDPFAGSGSTGVAAIREGYRFIGAEKVSAYVGVSHERLEAEVEGHSVAARRAGQLAFPGGAA